MTFKTHSDLKWLEFELLKPFPGLRHGVLTSYNTSKNHPHNLNISNSTLETKLSHNLDTIKRACRLHQPVFCKQPHGNQVEVASPTSFLNCDGLITNQRKLTLLIQHADCQATLLYDPCKKIIGNVHCGFRGNALNIYQSAIEKMQNDYQCNPCDIIACISPSLGPRSAEFIHYRQEFPKELWKYGHSENLFDLWQMGKDQLIDAGLLEHHIEVAQIDTYTSEDFFSYRKDHTSKRNVSFLMMK